MAELEKNTPEGNVPQENTPQPIYNCFDRWGFDEDGFNIDGYNREGYTKDGYDRGGYSHAGYDREGYDHQGINNWSCDRQGYQEATKPDETQKALVWQTGTARPQGCSRSVRPQGCSSPSFDYALKGEYLYRRPTDGATGEWGWLKLEDAQGWCKGDPLTGAHHLLYMQYLIHTQEHPTKYVYTLAFSDAGTPVVYQYWPATGIWEYLDLRYLEPQSMGWVVDPTLRHHKSATATQKRIT